ncbi:MAG TPA: Arc family DNA-binding protein [Thermoanaerobaculia bacterium]|jgi:plasmid stability protein|nr:Arc family DNA-binding protein [Thermoanaerobaculia bacterium]
MATLHVRNVPDEIYDRLRERAETSNRSLSAEVLVLLRDALEERKPSQRQVLAEIRRRRSFRPVDVGAPSSTDLLREDRGR